MRFILKTAMSAALLAVADQSAAEDIAFRGLGVDTCSAFTEFVDAEHMDGKKEGNVVDVETAYFIWAQGFMTGMNGILLQTGYQSTNLDGRSQQEQKDEIYDFCLQNPTRYYYSAAVTLFIRMRHEQGLPMWKGAQ